MHRWPTLGINLFGLLRVRASGVVGMQWGWARCLTPPRNVGQSEHCSPRVPGSYGASHRHPDQFTAPANDGGQGRKRGQFWIRKELGPSELRQCPASSDVGGWAPEKKKQSSSSEPVQAAAGGTAIPGHSGAMVLALPGRSHEPVLPLVYLLAA